MIKVLFNAESGTFHCDQDQRSTAQSFGIAIFAASAVLGVAGLSLMVVQKSRKLAELADWNDSLRAENLREAQRSRRTA